MFWFGMFVGVILTLIGTTLYHNANFKKALDEEKKKLMNNLDNVRKDIKDRL